MFQIELCQYECPCLAIGGDGISLGVDYVVGLSARSWPSISRECLKHSHCMDGWMDKYLCEYLMISCELLEYPESHFPTYKNKHSKTFCTKFMDFCSSFDVSEQWYCLFLHLNGRRMLLRPLLQFCLGWPKQQGVLPCPWSFCVAVYCVEYTYSGLGVLVPRQAAVLITDTCGWEIQCAGSHLS